MGEIKRDYVLTNKGKAEVINKGLNKFIKLEDG